MTIYQVEGGRPLTGELWAQGSKNAALPLLSAAVLAKEPVTLQNCPVIDDVAAQLEILRALGCTALRLGDSVRLEAGRAQGVAVPRELMGRMRSSVMLLGALLGRHRRGQICTPGGCAIGARPIDYHLRAFEQMGVRIDLTLPSPSVGATENVMLLAAALPRTTVLRRAAREPEIEDLAALLNKMGADIQGAGTDRITIRGGELGGACHRVQGDRIAAATDLCAAAVTGGSLTLRGIRPRHMACALAALRRMGCGILTDENTIWLSAPPRLRPFGRLVTAPYPGFPTDLQAPLLALAATAEGESQMVETMFENRFHHVAELAAMGADIDRDGPTLTVRGRPLKGACVTAKDLRGGAALLLAALAAAGRSQVADEGHIARGYEDIAARWCSLGAEITVCAKA